MRYFFAKSLILNQICLLCLFQQIRLLDFPALAKMLEAAARRERQAQTVAFIHGRGARRLV